MVAQPCEYTRKHCIVQFKMLNLWYANYVSISKKKNMLLLVLNEVTKINVPARGQVHNEHAEM